MPAKPTEVYDSSKLKLVEGLEHVRTRPGMYVGSTGPKGLYHLIDEIVANSVDEAMAGHCKRVVVDVRADGWVEVSDDARGIPVDTHEETGISGLELVLTKLGAGGKWGEEGGGYKVSGGLHGVGASVVNALSEKMDATVRRDGHEWRQSYARGIPTGPVKKGKASKETGTTLAWKFDEKIFDKGISYDRTKVENRLRELSYLNPGLELVLKFHGHKDETFSSKAGLVDFMKYLVAEHENVEAVHRQPISLQGEVTDEVEDRNGKAVSDTTAIELALFWTTQQGEVPNMFVNCINTFDGGTHYDGLRSGLRKALNEVAEEMGKFRAKDAKFEQADTREGLFLAISVRVSEPNFESQTKIRLGNVEVQKRVEQFVSTELRRYLLDKKNHAEAESVIQRVIEARDGRIAASQARAAVTTRKGLLGNSGLPGKLADCSSKDREETEIFIVEGDSAGGGMKRKRNRVTQAIMPLRGKIQNVEKSHEAALSSDAIKDILSALGGNITSVQVEGKKGGKVVKHSKMVVDLSEPRYGKIVICSVDHQEMTFIKTPEGRIECVRIGEFIDQCCGGAIDPEGHQVLCFGLTSQQTQFRPIKQVIRHPMGDEKLHLIRTSYGRNVRATSSHSIFLYEDGQVVLKPADQIQVGDHVLAPRSLPLAGGTLPQQLDLLAALSVHPEAASRLIVRGPAVARLYRENIQSRLHGTHHGHERVQLSRHAWRKLRQVRQEQGCTLMELAGACGVREAASVSEWETGRGRPSVQAMRSYCEYLQLDPSDVVTDASIRPSVISGLQERGKGSANEHRVRSVVRLSDLSPGGISMLGDDLSLASEKHNEQTAIGRYLPLDERLFFLLGLYAAEGSLGERVGVRFHLGPRDERILEEISEASRALFRVLPQRYPSTGRGFEFRIPSAVAGHVFGSLCGYKGSTSHTKEFPQMLFDATPELQLEFLRGYYLGDGSYDQRGKITFNTVSLKMAEQVLYLLQVHGVVAGMHVVEPAKQHMLNGRPINSGTSYQVVVSDRGDMVRLRRVWESRHDAVDVTARILHVFDEKLLSEEMDAEQIALYTGCSSSGVRLAMRSGQLPPTSDKKRDRLVMRADVVRWAQQRQEQARVAHRRFLEVSEDLIALPVISCGVIAPTSEYVYDFSVASDENFICGGGGLCAHNTDADVDGGHITTLLMTFFYRFAPDIIRKGRLWVTELPLFRVEHKQKGRYYVHTDEELQKLVKEDAIKKTPDGRAEVMRFKGLGEMEAEQLEELALNPETRRMKRIVIDDLAEAEDITVLLMGKQVSRRRDYIEEHALDVEADV